mmetsp:Transcript_17375/g.36814  ORF Transcript_17375/g.36814 Transcript_17375/m.36814 type:complete len:80 (+) Transcript_17375:377-616(+)|eukprot:5088288-Pleurochrysis_carterae.AAC.1
MPTGVCVARHSLAGNHANRQDRKKRAVTVLRELAASHSHAHANSHAPLSFWARSTRSAAATCSPLRLSRCRRPTVCPQA